MEIIKFVATGMLGTIGFAVLFSIKQKHILLAALGGGIATLVYVLLDIVGVNLFVSNFVATLICVIYSNILARLVKTPSMVFITASIIPLVPGGALFYAMSNLILGDSLTAKTYGLNALQVALGIAGGIVIESLIVTIMIKLIRIKKISDAGK